MSHTVPLAERRAAASAIWRDIRAERGFERSILLASTFRSGSTYVAVLLEQNGLPGLDIERFAEAWRFMDPPPGEAFADFLREVMGKVDQGLFTSKVMWPHLGYLARSMGYGRPEASVVADLFAPARWVHVCRQDKFSQAISFWRAKQSGRWHVYAADRSAEPQPDYDFGAIRAALQEIEMHDRLWEDFFAQAGITPFRVIYEEMEADPVGGMARLLDHLGVASATPVAAVSLRKQRDAHSAALRERFLDDLYRA